VLQRPNVSAVGNEHNEAVDFLLSSTTVHYIRAAADGKILACSPAVGKLLRLSTESVLGRPVWQLMPDSEAITLRKHMGENKSGQRFHLNLWTSERTPFPVDCVTYRTPDGFVLIGEALAGRDEERIQLRMAAELRRSHNDLEQFAYIASHDLQEPLRTVLGFAKMLQRKYRGKLDAQADEYIEFCVSGVKRMQDLIGALLTYSRVSRNSDRRERVDLNEIVQETIMYLGRAMKEANAEVTYGTLPSIWGNRQQMFQVVENLISNGLKFRSNRPAKISITADAGEGKWVISVVDNGVGIERQYLERIFEPFQRLHGREYDGSGIGLALCRKIIERHGGGIWAESKVGEGSVIRFTLEDAAGQRPRKQSE